MFITGHEALDADHARIGDLWSEIRCRLADGDRRGAAETCQHLLRFFLDHWVREEGMLARTDWPRPILHCHIDDHDRLERRLVGMLTRLNGDGRSDAEEIDDFGNDLLIHMTTFDHPLVERLNRGTDRHQRRQPS